MKASKLIEKRRSNWHELESLCSRLDSMGVRRMGPGEMGRFASLYRAVCADLALAEANQLPPGMVDYLHQLVAKAHNLLYPSRKFALTHWLEEIFLRVPGRLLHDPTLWLAFLLFWGTFIGCMLQASMNPSFAEKYVGLEVLQTTEFEYELEIVRTHEENALMFGKYVNHNTTIGLRCFAYGLLGGVGGLFETVYNALLLGTIFGYMINSSASENFFDFVTAHGPFELTAIVLSAAAGMRIGFSWIFTGGLTRRASLIRGARRAFPTAGAAVILFFLAAVIEGFISPTTLPYVVKAAVAAISTALMVGYFVILGLRAGDPKTWHDEDDLDLNYDEDDTDPNQKPKSAAVAAHA